MEIRESVHECGKLEKRQGFVTSLKLALFVNYGSRDASSGQGSVTSRFQHVYEPFKITPITKYYAALQKQTRMRVRDKHLLSAVAAKSLWIEQFNGSNKPTPDE